MKLSAWFFIALFTSLFLAIFYSTVTNMAGIYIVSELGGSIDISVYALVAFGLGNTLTIPIANPLADRLGPIYLLIGGLLVYTLFSVLCGLAETFVWFNIFRFGLGLASGLFFILFRRLIIDWMPASSLEKHLFFMTLMYAIVPVFGASFGAWLAYENYWRWIFHLNAPISFFLALYFWIYYRHLNCKAKTIVPFDGVGYLFFVIGIGCLVSAATLSQQLDWYRSPTLVFLTLAGVPSLLFFLLWEWRWPTPFLEISLLRSPLLSYALLNLAVLFSAYFGMIILITLWLNIYANYTPWWITALIGTMAVASIIAYLLKILLCKYDPRWTLAISISCFAISCYYSTYFDIEVDFFHLAVARFLSGIGILFLFPIRLLAFHSYGHEKESSIFTLFQLTRTLFSSLGAALYVVLWQRRQVFFHERMGEGLTINDTLTLNYFRQATQLFHLTDEQAQEQLNVFLDEKATSLGLNDVFGCMGYILLGLLILLAISFFFFKPSARQIPNIA